MTLDQSEPQILYRVVVNEEEQYSIWPADRPLPLGWSDTGNEGSKSECLDHIGTVWTDMRPLSLRKYLAALDQESAAPRLPVNQDQCVVDDLVTRLSTGDHPVELSIRDPSPQTFRSAIEQDRIRVRFIGTMGGTELGLHMDRKLTCMEKADFDAGSGSVYLVGTLTVDFVPVRCVANIDLANFTGVGHLERLDSNR